MELRHKRIVAIDDTGAIRTFLRISLEAQQVQFFEASNAAEGLTLCASIQPDLVVLDLGLPDRDGLDILPEIKGMNKNVPPKIVILTVRKDQRTIDQAITLGANAFITKPFIMDDLLEILREQLKAAA